MVLTCHGDTGQQCSGDVDATTEQTFTGKSILVNGSGRQAASPAAKKRSVLIGAASYHVAAGRSGKVPWYSIRLDGDSSHTFPHSSASYCGMAARTG